MALLYLGYVQYLTFSYIYAQHKNTFVNKYPLPYTRNMKLKDYLKEVPIRVGDFATKVPMSRSHLNDVMKGRVKPSDFLKRKIEIATKGKVGMDDWPDKKEEH